MLLSIRESVSDAWSIVIGKLGIMNVAELSGLPTIEAKKSNTHMQL